MDVKAKGLTSVDVYVSVKNPLFGNCDAGFYDTKPDLKVNARERKDNEPENYHYLETFIETYGDNCSTNRNITSRKPYKLIATSMDTVNATLVLPFGVEVIGEENNYVPKIKGPKY